MEDGDVKGGEREGGVSGTRRGGYFCAWGQFLMSQVEVLVRWKESLL